MFPNEFVLVCPRYLFPLLHLWCRHSATITNKCDICSFEILFSFIPILSLKKKNVSTDENEQSYECNTQTDTGDI